MFQKLLTLWKRNQVRIHDINSIFDYNLITERDSIEGFKIEILDLGNLILPSGKIVVCDPLMADF